MNRASEKLLRSRKMKVSIKSAYQLAFIFTWALFQMSNAVYAKTLSYTQKTHSHSNLILPETQVRHIKSKVNNVDYKLYISLPAGYYNNKIKYPVVFLLDADYSFPIAKSIVEHLSNRNRMKEVLIVGIAYDGPSAYKLNRTRDYTPVFVKDGGYGAASQKKSGGAKRFVTFIRTELLPYIDANFHVNHTRTLVGHSFGGLFATWLSLSDSNSFDSYIIVSPSLWYGKHYIFTLLQEIINQKPGTRTRAKLFYGIGEKENSGTYRMVADLKKLVKIQKSHVKKNLKFIIFPYEDHDTVFPTALSQGLLFIYGETENHAAVN